MSFATSRPHHRDVLGAFVIAVFSITGALWSVLLTILKFRSTFTGEATVLSTCRGSCSLAFRDAWSELAGLPITIYGASFFITSFLLASAILLAPHRFSHSGRPLTTTLALGGVIASLTLALRAELALGSACELCAVLYLACVGLLIGALIHAGPKAWSLPALRRRWWQDRLTVLIGLVVASAFAALTAVQFKVYRASVKSARERSLLTVGEAELSELPEPSIRLPASGEARIVVALFLDLSCSFCRAEIEVWLRRQQEYGDYLELGLYHFPESRHGRSHNARGAARALHCLATAHPEQSRELVAEMFTLQDGAAPYFEPTKLTELAARHGVDEDALAGCMKDPRIDTMIRHHTELARSAGIEDAPGLIIGGLRGGSLVGGQTLSGGLHEALVRDLIERLLSDHAVFLKVRP